ncbi:MAG: hypothetical protein COT81_02775 [Candidatus Buchananbacteria bacterium CG10_big_fil_rev_8_21_14_0_10_42_9]|uniref:Nudix hydrolase domain-containing protein n=1 Tax=Candidatus Buchananbacteria bacterium CG10_big_fil_rev_8_21_14_0_10_42_9 TaxID=1974526 RepID=A0A2H0W199_9BACT|nr:MAG: hypothetical protein COT81_02775 [Candidatus Buchananbacteria bacterium CG10_big_fil_rev_8_21_14_0_10_42_9]
MAEFKHFDAVSHDGDSVKVTIVSGPVILDDSKILLDKHSGDGLWKFPGGKLIDDNSPRDNAIREVHEELGIDIEIQSEPYVVAFTRDYEGVTEYIILIHYLADYSGQIQPAPEIEEWGWHDVDNLPDDCAPNIKLAV